MNKLFNLSFAFFFFIALFSCGKKRASGLDDPLAQGKTFVLPQVPTLLTSTMDRNTYLALHYFDRFDFKDTTLIHMPDVGEQGIVNFIALLGQVPTDVQDSAVFLALRGASVESKMYSYFWKTLDRYLNNPNSPIRNEDLYILVCESVVKLPKVDEVITSNAAFNLKQALKNRVGMLASNFQVALESGKRVKMTDLKGTYTLLFFYEPDCHTCIQTKTFMKGSEFLNRLVDDSTVSVLAFYPQDDKLLWLQRLSDCSPNWVNGYDPDGYFAKKQPYDLHAFPSFYLLDSNKKVLLKDVPIEVVLRYLEQNGADSPFHEQ
jgi:hypothetical protein